MDMRFRSGILQQVADDHQKSMHAKLFIDFISEDLATVTKLGPYL